MGNILDGARELLEAKHYRKGDDILKVMDILSTYCFDFVIAGGYARDLYYGKDPKDCDICVYNFNEKDFAERALFKEMVRKLQSRYATHLMPEYEKGDSRLGMVIKLDEIGVDIIFYKGATTFIDVLKQFDCNMNQFYIPCSLLLGESARGINPEGLKISSHLAGKEPDSFQFLTNDLSCSRILKMAAKWSAYTGKPITDGLSSAMVDSAKSDLEDSMYGDIPF